MANCQDCSYFTEVYAGNAGTFDCFCSHNDALKDGKLLIERDVRHGTPVKVPAHCPMLKNLNLLKVKDEKVMERKRTYYEQCQEYDKAVKDREWSDLKEGNIYHYPPVYKERRGDYLIIRKNEFHIFTREVLYDKKILGEPKYFYKSDKKYKFLQENKIKKFDLKTIKKNSNFYGI